MTRKPQTVSFWRGHLPHWEVEDGRYFVTIHLAGAIPVSGEERIREISEELAKFPRDQVEKRLQIHRRIFGEMERWLDRVSNVAYLQSRRVAEMVREATQFRNKADWHMLEYA